MKEFFAAFAIEIFRPIITLLIPGIWALTPGVLALFLKYEKIWQFTLTHKDASSLVFLTVATSVGLILENLGGELENHFFDKHGDEAKADWYRYLRTASEPDLKAFSYIRSYVLRLKFEGGMAAGSVAAMVGTLYLPVPIVTIIVFLCCEAFLLLYLVLQVKSSVTELVNVRHYVFGEAINDNDVANAP